MHPYLAVPDKLPARVTYFGQSLGGYPRVWFRPEQIGYRDEQLTLDALFYRDHYPKEKIR